MEQEKEQWSPEQWRPWIIGPNWPGYEYMSPYAWPSIEIRRGQYGEISTIDPSKLDPMFNVYGLFWRPTPGVNHYD